MNLKTNWVLQIDPTVLKTFKKIPRADTHRILGAIQSLPDDPYAGDIQKMHGERNVWRRRIGNFRIFYEIILDEKLIHVFSVERRTSTTY